MTGEKSRTFTHLVGISTFIGDVDRLVARGELKPLWCKIVRRPEFQSLAIKAMKDTSNAE